MKKQTIQTRKSKTQSILTGLMCIVLTPLLFSACSNKGSAKQRQKFQEAVKLESETRSIPDRLSVYMEVVSMDPKSETGQAARERVDQLSKEMASLLGGVGN